MFKLVGRALAALLVAWFGFVLWSLFVAWRRTQEVSLELPPEDADDFAFVTLFNGQEFHSTARALRHATIETRFGGGMLDLRGATLDPAGAVVDVTTIFGGGQLIVPETWRVTSAVKGIGGIGDMRPPRELPEDAPHLTIEGLTLFGGFGITSAPMGRTDGTEASEPAPVLPPSADENRSPGDA